MQQKLGVYSALDQGPLRRSYAGKLFLLTVCAFLVPMLTLLVVLFTVGGTMIAWIGIGVSFMVLALVYLGIKALLAPLQLIQGAMEAFSENGNVPDLETSYRDLAGRLMANTQRVLAQLEHTKKIHVVDHTTDPLTGLLNARSATRRLGSDLLRSMRDKKPLCVAVIEVDNLFEIATQHGNQVEDEVVKFVAKKISACLRRSDWVACLGRHVFLAGLWGVEMAKAKQAMQRLIEEVSKNKSHTVQLAIGVAESTRAKTPDRIIALALGAAAKSRQGAGNSVMLDLTPALPK